MYSQHIFISDENGGTTWVSSQGRKRRIDYVAVPRRWSPYVTAAFVHRRVNLALRDKLDHRLARVSVEAPVETSTGEVRPGRKGVPPSRKALLLPEFQAGLKAAWASLPALPVGCCLQEAVNMLTKFMRITWAGNCGRDRRAQRQTWMDQSMWEATLRHSQLRTTSFAMKSCN